MGYRLCLLVVVAIAGCGDNLRPVIDAVATDAPPDTAVDAAPVNDCTGMPDNTVCNDGNACTQTDRCTAGACVGASPVTCMASDACHVAGTCDPATGACSNPNAPDTTVCDDSNACTQTDRCTAGACIGSNPAPDSSPCDDANACTQTDTCVAGTCTGANPIVCTAQDGCHVAGTCDPSNGTCSNPNAPDGTSCNDSNACTQTDTCTVGTCNGANPVTCTALDQCHVAGTCDVNTGLCSDPFAPDNTTCNDANACTQTDTCTAGTCNGANPVTCTASDQCHVAGTCDPGTGTCSNPNAPNGTVCNDSNACTQNDACTAGTCGGAAVVCTASDQCHGAGTCDPVTGCSNPPLMDGTACNDGSLCTMADACTAGVCGGNALICTASDQCHVAGTCDPSTGTCSNPNAPNGTGCSDGNACTQTDACSSGACVGGNPVVCSAPACNVAGTCNPATGACSASTPQPNGTACSDGNACTQGELCAAGSCSGGSPVICSASDQCHVAGTCNPATGCSNPPAMDGTSCNDNNACTSSDACTAGSCGGAALPDGTSCGASTTCVAAACTCGNGTVDATEQCDDSNPVPCDGCGHTCRAEAAHRYVASIPSGGACMMTPDCPAPLECVGATPPAVPGTCRLTIVDGDYNGTVGTMRCVDFTVPTQGDGVVDYVCAQTGIDHTWIGDLVVKVLHGSDAVTLVSRPGDPEPSDGTSVACGNSADLASTHPIMFFDGGPFDAELMGGTFPTSGCIIDVLDAVCRDDNQCQFDPNPGAATPGALDTFTGEPGMGLWRFCVGDGATPDAGNIESVTLTIVQ